MKSLIRAIVDSAALRHNLARVRTTAPGSGVMAVIKANAYGHGLVPAAKAMASRRPTRGAWRTSSAAVP